MAFVTFGALGVFAGVLSCRGTWLFTSDDVQQAEEGCALSHFGSSGLRVEEWGRVGRVGLEARKWADEMLCEQMAWWGVRNMLDGMECEENKKEKKDKMKTGLLVKKNVKRQREGMTLAQKYEGKRLPLVLDMRTQPVAMCQCEERRKEKEAPGWLQLHDCARHGAQGKKLLVREEYVRQQSEREERRERRA